MEICQQYQSDEPLAADVIAAARIVTVLLCCLY